MKLQVTFKKPGLGFYRTLISPGETLRFSHGRARRQPADEENMFNSIPVKYITSIKLVDVPAEVCSVCGKEKSKVVCYDCIVKTLTKPSGRDEFLSKIKHKPTDNE